MEQPRQALPTTIRSPPSIADYTPLAEYQAQTPASFVGGRPVLYFHAAGAKAFVPLSQREQLPFFPLDGVANHQNDGQAEDSEEEKMVEQTVDLFVNSETFTIFSPSSEVGLAIPYPTIGIQAIRTFTAPSNTTPTRSVYMQLNLSDGGADDETYDTVELTLVLPSTDAEIPTGNATTSSDPTAALFSALSTCQDLHPDPTDDDSEASYDIDSDSRIVFESAFDDPDSTFSGETVSGFTGVYRGAGDGGLPPPMPGSTTGWITAENVHEFFDEDGNWIAGAEDGEGVSGELGEGAGRVRGRDEVEGEDTANGSNGERLNGSREDEDSKRARRE